MGALKLLAKLRRYDPRKTVEEYLVGEMRQNFQAIEDALGRFPQFKVIEAAIGTSTDATFQHDLGVVPTGFVVISADVFGNVKLGSTAWTSQNAYLIADAAGTYKVIFFYLKTLS